ncbi:MAG: hypothetical protein ABEH43_03560, partial [Flavobacteriales bacterium]
VIDRTGIDTVLPDKENDPYLFEEYERFVITSFDSGYHPIPPFKFIVNGDTVKSQAKLLRVNSVDVDTSKSIRKIKDIYSFPFSFTEWFTGNWEWFAGFLGLVAVVVLIMYIIKKRNQKEEEVEEEPVTPAHEIALKRLDRLLEKKLWQNGMIKDYHAEISELVREYLENRFQINALEQTTNEIMPKLRYCDISSRDFERVGYVLRLTDMVKFAKERPLADENEKISQYVRAVINNTKMEEPAEDEEESEDDNEKIEQYFKK